LHGWLRDEGFEQALIYANACGALVVSRHGCDPAMPTSTELDYFLAIAANSAQAERDPELVHLHRATTQRRQ
jgi:5-dehydro-2-deoxygluconokinase